MPRRTRPSCRAMSPTTSLSTRSSRGSSSAWPSTIPPPYRSKESAPVIVADRDPPILIDVALGARRYDLMIGRGLLAELGALVAARRPRAAVALVSDAVVASHHLAAAQAALTAAGVRTTPVVIASGEGSKSWNG